METTILLKNPPVHLAPKQEISPEQLLAMLKDICENRYESFQRVKGKITYKEWTAVYRIRILLEYAELSLSWRDMVKYCLRAELDFHTIADRSSNKKFEIYMKRINGLMNACRSSLGRTLQW